MHNSRTNPQSITNPQIINNIPRDHVIFEPPKYLKDPNYIPLTNGIASLGLPTILGLSPNNPNTQVFQSTKKLEHMNCIIEADSLMGGLYIGDIISTVKPGVLQSGKIEALLTCNFQENHFHTTARRDIKLTTKIIDCKDNLDYPIQMHFPASFQFIQANRKQKKNVLVNCHAGKSRSGTIVCAYLIRKYKWTAERALNTIRNKRDRVKPNNGFWEKLLKYEKQILGDLEQIYPTSQSKAQIIHHKQLQQPENIKKDQFNLNLRKNFQAKTYGTNTIKFEENIQQKDKLSLKNATKSIKSNEKYSQITKSTPNFNINTFQDFSQKRAQNHIPVNSVYGQPLGNFPIYNQTKQLYQKYPGNLHGPSPYQNYQYNYNPNAANYAQNFQTPQKINNNNLYYSPIQNKSISTDLSHSHNKIYRQEQPNQQENPQIRKKLLERANLKLGQKIKRQIQVGKHAIRQPFQ